jgi:hypothetical protein
MVGDRCTAKSGIGLCRLRVTSGKAQKEQMLSALARKADIASLPRYVRSVPIGDIMHRSKDGRYSITSSARASSVGGISRPSVFAVLRLMTSSNLVGCITGKSAGLSPLRILPT